MGGSNVSPDLYREERYRYGKFTCDVCGNAWPMTHQRTERGGARVGVLCCFEEDGDEFTRDIRRAAASKFAAQLSAKELQPPQAPDGSVYAGSPEFIDSLDPGIVTITPFPIHLIRGGSAVPVVVSGFNFVSTNTFVYGNAGITDSSPPVFVSSAEWDLSVKASAGMQAGSYPMTFGNSIRQAVFNVGP
jgi:hypothetical protein